MKVRNIAAWTGLGLAVVGSTIASRAQAGNASKPRILAEFPDAPCMVVVDRDVDPLFHVAYTIAEEDLGPLTDDEVDDSRRHQFFAFQKDFSYLPNWITQADVDAAAAFDLVDPAEVAASQVLEHDPEWSEGEWLRINADDARLPIDFATANAGVDWDTSGVPAGTWVLAAYTWEPATNEWSKRAGAVRVVDGAADLASAAPSLALAVIESESLSSGDVFSLRGCAVAMEESTLQVTWEIVGKPDSGVLYEGPIPDTTFELELSAPDIDLGVELVRLRAVLTDPEGRSYEARAPNEIQVAGDEPGDESGGGGEACAVTSRNAPATLPLVLVLLGVARRRHRAPVYCGDVERRR